MGNSDGATILYRGPLQRSRLSFLGESAAARYAETTLLWVSPRPATKRRVEHFQEFLTRNPCFDDWEIIDGRKGSFFQTVRRLRSAVKNRRQPILAVGFTALFYARRVARGPLVWCVNGIPEERLMYNETAFSRTMVRALWLGARRGREPELVITVSSRMARLIRRRCGFESIVAAPNCPVADFFEPADDAGPRPYLTYLGTAAPWQRVDLLAEVWRELHARDPSLCFRVISRDPGCRVLGDAIAADRIDFCASDDPRRVGEWLQEARAGFLLRDPDLINEVSFPLKFGEYLAAGCPVITSDIDWDPGDIVRETGCGMLVPPGTDVVEAVLSFLADSQGSALVRAGAARLVRDDHVRAVCANLPAARRS